MNLEQEAFLKAALSQAAGLNQKDLLPFLMTLSRQANDQKISFSDEDADLMYQQMKHRLSSEQQQQLELIRTLLKQKHRPSGSGPEQKP